MDQRILEAVDLTAGKKPMVALTGAGISVESGIPDFRSAGGLWERFDPMEYATISAFRRRPEKVWEMLWEMDQVIGRAEPNPAHLALAELERMGRLTGIVTQNIDGLHQKAGSTRVVEFHGNAGRLVCLNGCGSWPAEELRAELGPGRIPRCSKCDAVLKPDVVFFGEAIPSEALSYAFHLAETCEAMLVVGTSATVAPASHLPLMALRAGAVVLEINLEETMLSSLVTMSLLGSCSSILPDLVEAMETNEA